MLNLDRTNAFKRDFKKHAELSTALIEILYLLLNNEPLPEKYRDHELIGNYKGFRECHVKPDLLLIYKRNDDSLIFVRLGTHSDLF